LTTFKKIETSNEVHQLLGFSERRVYQFDSEKNKSAQQILADILETRIFFEIQMNWNIKSKKYQYNSYHAFTNKINIDDFEKLNFEELERRIKEIENESDWGEDLPIFCDLINKSKNWIVENNFQNQQIYFLYDHDLSEEKTIAYNYYDYFMTIVIISIVDCKVVIINHGED